MYIRIATLNWYFMKTMLVLMSYCFKINLMDTHKVKLGTLSSKHCIPEYEFIFIVSNVNLFENFFLFVSDV